MAIDVTGNIYIIAHAQTRELTETEKKMRALAKAQREHDKATKDSLKSLAMFGVGLTALSVVGAKVIKDSTMLAARTEALGVVVDQLGDNAGYTTAQMDRFTEGVKAQGITLRHSRQAIAMMIQANVDLEQSTRLAALAQDAAVIANLNSSETFTRLIAVVQTGNIRMARHLGLVVDFQKAYLDAAKAQGISVKQLDQTAKVQIRVNEIFRAGANIAGAYDAAMTTAGKKMLSLERHVENAQVAIGNIFLPALGDVVDMLTEWLKGIDNLEPAQKNQLGTTLAQVTAFAAVSGAIMVAVPALVVLKTAFVALGTTIGIATGGLSLLLGLIAALGVGAALHASNVNKTEEAITALAHEVAIAGGGYEEFKRKEAELIEAHGLEYRAVEEVTQMHRGKIAVLQIEKGDITGLVDAEFKLIEAQEAGRSELKLWIEGHDRSAKAIREHHGIAVTFKDDLFKLSGAMSDFTKSTITNLIYQKLWDEVTADGFISDADLKKFRNFSYSMGVELPEDIGFAVSAFNSLATDGIDPAVASADALNNSIFSALEMDGSDINIYVKQHGDVDIPTGGGGGGGGTTTTPSPKSPPQERTGGGESEFALGGMLGSGVNLVGERGPELIIGNRVFDTATTMALLATGIFPSLKKFALAQGTGGSGGGSAPTIPTPAPEPDFPPKGEGGGGTSTPSGGTTSPADTATQATDAAVDVIQKSVTPALAAIAIAVPTAQDIAAGIQEAQLAQVKEQLRQGAALLEEMQLQTEILSDQGTSSDIGRAIRDNIQAVT